MSDPPRHARRPAATAVESPGAARSRPARRSPGARHQRLTPGPRLAHADVAVALRHRRGRSRCDGARELHRLLRGRADDRWRRRAARHLAPLHRVAVRHALGHEPRHLLVELDQLVLLRRGLRLRRAQLLLSLRLLRLGLRLLHRRRLLLVRALLLRHAQRLLRLRLLVRRRLPLHMARRRLLALLRRLVLRHLLSRRRQRQLVLQLLRRARDAVDLGRHRHLALRGDAHLLRRPRALLRGRRLHLAQLVGELLQLHLGALASVAIAHLEAVEALIDLLDR